MGKRERRRQRESGEPSPPRDMRLGAPGPYIVCAVCNEPLNPHTRIGDDTVLRYCHSLEFVTSDGRIIPTSKPYDHEPAPVEGTPIAASLACDFCHAPDPRYAFVPRRPVRVTSPLDPVTELDYSSPWSCCDGCLRAVQSRNITRMLNRAFWSVHGSLSKLPAEEQAIFRKPLRLLYAKYLDSDPAGPYEIRIRPDHTPIGKRGSHRGG